jgi:hypothetical protein
VLQGVLEWGELEPGGEGQRFTVNRAQVYHGAGTAQVVIRSREQMAGAQSQVVTYGPFSPQSDGIFRFKVNGRYQRVRVLMSGPWIDVRGCDVRGAPLGGR